MKRKDIENLVGEDMEDMGLSEHFDDEGNVLKTCTECGITLPPDYRYGDCEMCLGRRYGNGNY